MSVNRVYTGLAQIDRLRNQFAAVFNAVKRNEAAHARAGAAAEQGLVWFAEHLADAEANPGKHPNIDLLFRVKAENLKLSLKALPAE